MVWEAEIDLDQDTRLWSTQDVTIKMNWNQEFHWLSPVKSPLASKIKLWTTKIIKLIRKPIIEGKGIKKDGSANKVSEYIIILKI